MRIPARDRLTLRLDKFEDLQTKAEVSTYTDVCAQKKSRAGDLSVSSATNFPFETDKRFLMGWQIRMYTQNLPVYIPKTSQAVQSDPRSAGVISHSYRNLSKTVPVGFLSGGFTST